jgi:hypothetical protein
MRHFHRTFAQVTALSAAVVALAAGPATAASPHFVRGDAQTGGSSLTVSFKEAGLGNALTVTVQASADYVAVFQCINGGGKNPSAANKTTIDGSTSQSGTFVSDRNGNVVGTLILQAPTVTDNGFSCPPGQRETLAALSWSDVRVDDLTTSASYAVATEPVVVGHL